MIVQRYSILLFFLSGFWCYSQDFDSLVNNFVKNKAFIGAKISLLAVDLLNSDTLLSYQSNLATATASTTKLFSTAMALEILGPEYTFETGIFTDGSIVNGTLEGNIWIRGGGDVSLGSKFFCEEGKEFQTIDSWIDSLRKMGIKAVNGTVYADASAFGYEGTPQGWSSWDVGNYFGAFPAGLNVYDNIAKYYFSTGKPGTRANFITTFPYQKNLQLSTRIISANIKGDRSNIQGRAYDEHRIATGKLPAYQSRYMVKGSVADPENNFAEVMKARFLLDSLPVAGGFKACKGLRTPDYNVLQCLFSHKGRTVKEIANWTNLKSVNFFAEGLLNGVAFKITGKGTNANALEIYRRFYASKIDTTSLRLIDGSGLSRRNRIAAGHLCDLLRYMNTSKEGDHFFNTLPIAGHSGTISDLCRGAAGDGRIFAKSGSMTGIKSYAGYIHTISGKKLVFAFIVNGFSCGQSTVKKQMEILLNSLSIL